MTAVFRRLILLAAGNRFVSGFVRRYGMRLGASRFISGETLDAAVPAIRRLNDAGLKANTTLLGEGLHDTAAVQRVADAYAGILDRIAAERLTCNVALKLTHLGLNLGEDVAYGHLARLLRHAATHGNCIRIDMEESARVNATLRIYRRARADGFDNVGTVLQSYLYRAGDDLTALLPLAPNLRLVKGAYLEPPEIAYPKKADVDRNYVTLAERMLQSCGYSAIATHDERIIEHVIAFANTKGIGNDRFEFQMLYGIRPQLQLDLVRHGYRVLVAAPFGPEWYPFFMRRLAERPANVLFVLRNLVRG
ncbi:MAG: proline dehydrogenase [Armatimonadetes bacterium]|nr:proline dehydrogenase [Armatimonadota bacterium]